MKTESETGVPSGTHFVHSHPLRKQPIHLKQKSVTSNKNSELKNTLKYIVGFLTTIFRSLSWFYTTHLSKGTRGRKQKCSYVVTYCHNFLAHFFMLFHRCYFYCSVCLYPFHIAGKGVGSCVQFGWQPLVPLEKSNQSLAPIKQFLKS